MEIYLVLETKKANVKQNAIAIVAKNLRLLRLLFHLLLFIIIHQGIAMFHIVCLLMDGVKYGSDASLVYTSSLMVADLMLSCFRV